MISELSIHGASASDSHGNQLVGEVLPKQGRSRRRFVILLTVLHFALLLYSAWIHSPNHLEASLLPSGYLHLKYGRFDVAQVNTPLSRMACSLPLFLFEPHEEWGSLHFNEDGHRPEYPIGEEFIENNLSSVREMFFAGRVVAALFSLIGAFSVYKIAQHLYGGNSAMLAFVLWCFSPLILGHGSTIGHDVPGAAMLAFAFLCYLRMSQSGRLLDVVVFGLASGFAFLTRTTNAAVIGLWLICWLIRPAHVRSLKAATRQSGKMAFVLAIMLFVLNIGYEFSGSLTPLGEFEFRSRALSGRLADKASGNRFRGTIWQDIPVPLPSDFVRGLDLQQRDFETPPSKSYMCGEWRARGWWYYYLFAWAIKTPIGFQMTFLIALATFFHDLRGKAARQHETLLLGTACFVFLLASVKSGFTTHYRYVLPAFPFVAVLSARVWRNSDRPLIARYACAGLVGFGIISSMLVYPHSIAYFNQFVGGPKNGGKYLLHSSCDWGQDIYLLEDWYHNNRDQIGKEIYVQCNGKLKPRLLGISGNSMPRRPSTGSGLTRNMEPVEPGIYAVSVSHLYRENSPYRYVDAMKPIDHVGYSIKIYDVGSKIQRP